MRKKVRSKTTMSLSLSGEKLDFTLHRNRLSKSLKLSIRSDGSILVSAPPGLSQNRIDGFLQDKKEWILGKRNLLLKKRQGILKTDQADYQRNKEKARQIVRERIGYFRDFYGLRIGRVSIRNQRTRWGSCSSAGNLNFNYRLVYLPSHLVDYLIVHEICHLQEMNHSADFWALVSRAIPKCKQARRELREAGSKLF